MAKTVYHVHTQGQPEVFTVSNHRPEGAEAPPTEGWMRYIPGTGFEVTMRCWETDPKVVYMQPDDPVSWDSCMEVFLNCFPELPQYGYINVEMNAAGTVLCGFGTARDSREKVLKMGLPQPKVSVTKSEEWWQVQCILSEELLETLYGRPCRFAPGHEMRGNFYKCGSKLDPPHWASWSKVERLDFHTPEFFGSIKIV